MIQRDASSGKRVLAASVAARDTMVRVVVEPPAAAPLEPVRVHGYAGEGGSGRHKPGVAGCWAGASNRWRKRLL